jgi:hypothetical protein
MNEVSLRRIAIALYVLVISMGPVGFFLQGGVTFDDVFGLPFAGFATVGLVVALRQPRNPVGWVFLLVGLAPTVGFFTSAYAVRSTLTEGGLPGALYVEWVSSWAWFPGVGALVTFALLLFPDGRLPSRRWRAVPYLSAALIVAVVAGMALMPGRMEPFNPSLTPSINPFGLEGAKSLLEGLMTVAFPLVPILGLLCAASMAFRYRAAAPDQRQQIKWFAYSTVVLVAIILFEGPISALFGETVADAVFLAGMLFPSIGAGIGILKYRLYDIDVVINRTLVYGLLTAILAATYVGIVFVLQGVLGAVTQDSDVAVAGSTLAVAAMFRPLRARVQAFIDHRFDRRKYDARRTLEEFSSKLRDEVDLQHLARDLSAVVNDTMQPAHVSVWFRPGAAS